MSGRMLPMTIAGLALALAWNFDPIDGDTAWAQRFSPDRYAQQAGPHDLFYNYYVGPGNCGGAAVAGMYPSPRPTPPLVGHTYITYQPLMPHEFLYTHKRKYRATHSDGSVTRTRVRYGHGLRGQLNPRPGKALPQPVGLNWWRYWNY